ncbi:oligosaccharide flippase family protein [Candidatus Nomurabacteria bacterium]|nr:oligosaccharide flippase family protein [Candidatus Nomurabacteria bacterium]
MLNNNKGVIRTVGEGTLWMSGGNILMKLIGIFYVLIILSHLSVAEFGLVELALSIPGLLGIMNLSGLQPVLIADLVAMHTKGEVEKMRFLVSSYISLQTILSIMAAGSLFVATIFLKDLFYQDTILMVQILTLTFLVHPVRSLIIIGCNITHNYRRLALFSLMSEIVKIILVVTLLFVFDMGALGVVMAYVLTEIFVTCINIPIIFAFRRELFKSRLLSCGLFEPFSVLKNHAKWSVLQNGVYTFGRDIRPWIIQFFLGTQAVGIFGAAMGMYMHASSLFPLSRVIAPIIPAYVEQKNKLINFINHAIKYQLLVLMSAVFLIIVFMPFLLFNIFPDYKDAYPLFILLSLNLIASSFSRVFETAFHALKLQRDLFASIVVNTTLTICILPITIILFGIKGVAVEVFITGLIYTISRYKVLKNVLPDYSFVLNSLYTKSSIDTLILAKIKDNLIRGFKKVRNS